MHLEAHCGARMSATTKLLPLSQENYDIKTPVKFFLFYNCAAHSKKKKKERRGGITIKTHEIVALQKRV